jgi:hypothetical protein
MRWLIGLLLCFTTTVVTDDGRVLTCSTCCLGGSCATTCSRGF